MKTLKPRVFIGCSLEAKPIAAAVHENLRFSAEVTPWYSGVFNPSSYTMDDLEAEVRTTDFAIFIFHPDDISKIRGKYYASVRDNTMLEMGLFMGRLGRKRIFSFFLKILRILKMPPKSKDCGCPPICSD